MRVIRVRAEGPELSARLRLGRTEDLFLGDIITGARSSWAVTDIGETKFLIKEDILYDVELRCLDGNALRVGEEVTSTHVHMLELHVSIDDEDKRVEIPRGAVRRWASRIGQRQLCRARIEEDSRFNRVYPAYNGLVFMFDTYLEEVGRVLSLVPHEIDGTRVTPAWVGNLHEQVKPLIGQVFDHECPDCHYTVKHVTGLLEQLVHRIQKEGI